MFQVRDLSVKVFVQEEAPIPLFASGCKVCDSTPGLPPGCGITGAEDVEIQREGLNLLRRQLRGELN